jgi:hypothetical protein
VGLSISKAGNVIQAARKDARRTVQIGEGEREIELL